MTELQLERLFWVTLCSGFLIGVAVSIMAYTACRLFTKTPGDLPRLAVRKGKFRFKP
jgi:hypothetical protein